MTQIVYRFASFVFTFFVSSLLVASPMQAAPDNSWSQPKAKSGTMDSGSAMKNNAWPAPKAGNQAGQPAWKQKYAMAVRLTNEKKYDQAISVLKTISNKQDAGVYNYLGFTHRKIGQYDTAVAYYQKALEINPKYTLAMEYLGESYVEMGKMEKARVQLARLKQVCGAGCKEYKALQTAISTGKTDGWGENNSPAGWPEKSTSCKGGYRITRGGTSIATPYCGDRWLSKISGISFEKIRNNPTSRRHACLHAHGDPVVSSICGSDDPLQSTGSD